MLVTVDSNLLFYPSFLRAQRNVRTLYYVTFEASHLRLPTFCRYVFAVLLLPFHLQNVLLSSVHETTEEIVPDQQHTSEEEDEEDKKEEGEKEASSEVPEVPEDGVLKGDPKALMDEAMAEQEKRSETTESSSSKSYEVLMVKTASDADDLDTHTTSSDIEVITSPSSMGGGSPGSSTNGRNRFQVVRPQQQQQQQKAAGHYRTGSEVSVSGSEDNNGGEVDRLLRKLSEMNEVLEARESKMVEMSRANLELQGRMDGGGIEFQD